MFTKDHCVNEKIYVVLILTVYLVYYELKSATLKMIQSINHDARKAFESVDHKWYKRD